MKIKGVIKNLKIRAIQRCKAIFVDSTEVKQPNVEAQVYNNNKSCYWGKQNQKQLQKFN